MCCGSFFFRILHYTTVVSLFCGVYTLRVLSRFALLHRHLIMYVLLILFKMVFGVVIIFIAKVLKVVLHQETRFLFHLALRTKQAIE